ncbi:metallophosphoesterase [Candidatus Woesearchaeota archaeon]|nr:metallophosphoesterase [Candidatus Woesearchaeota archaeon]
MDKKEVVSYLLERGLLLSPDFLHNLPNDIDLLTLLQQLQHAFPQQPLFLNKDLHSLFSQQAQPSLGINWQEFERSRSLFEKGKNTLVYRTFLDLLQQQSAPEVSPLSSQQLQLSPFSIQSSPGTIKVLFSYDQPAHKRDVQDFVSHFRNRYEGLKNILLQRVELQDSTSIMRIKKKPEGEKVSLIGMIVNKNTTKNGNILLTVEDPTEIISVLINKNKEELFQEANDLVLDEVIGVTGNLGENILFCNSLYHPDIPLHHELKKSPDEAYALFISDIHFGMKQFLKDDFMKFVKWLHGEYGTPQQREMAKKIKYLFVVGDVVEGVGIYPGQEHDLELPDIYQQYQMAADYFKLLPPHLQIVLCAGNHDAVRVAEPQSILDPKYAKPLYELPNLIMVSNPAWINIHASLSFPGFDVLLYHGYSLTHFADSVPSIRSKGGQDRCDLILKFLLQRRHLAPTHGSNLYIPDAKDDPLVISRIPDIFVTGHIHRIAASTYRNVTLINSSCWVTQTENQAKRGIVPHPAKIPILNLQTREIRILNFRSDI